MSKQRGSLLSFITVFSGQKKGSIGRAVYFLQPGLRRMWQIKRLEMVLVCLPGTSLAFCVPPPAHPVCPNPCPTWISCLRPQPILNSPPHEPSFSSKSPYLPATGAHRPLPHHHHMVRFLGLQRPSKTIGTLVRKCSCAFS